MTTRLLSPAPVVAAFLFAAAPLAAQPELIDRVLAVVDEDPILQSEVEQVLALGLVESRPGEGELQLRRRAVDELVEQRLRFHEIDNYGFVELPAEGVEAGFDAIRKRFPSQAAFESRLEQLGLDADSLRQLVARQLMVLSYVNERLGPRVFVALDDIRAYYEETLVPELERRGAAVPQLQDVREDIRSLLKEQRLNEEIVLWTQELRRDADVEDYFDQVEGSIPENVVGSTGKSSR